jgi:hypothetical protein
MLGDMVVVDAPHFYAAIVFEGLIVVRAAPILAWTIGKKADYLSAYFQRKGWKATLVK